jgi:Tfp pilus assembly PilM family ATPase
VKPPLGVDLGTTRVRIAQLERGPDGLELRNVAAADIGGIEERDLPARIRELLRAAGIRRRRCVCGLGEPNATLRAVEFPPMSPGERRRAARYEAERYAARGTETAVTAVPLDGRRRWALAIADRAELRRRVSILRAAGLHVAAVDYDGLAYARLFPRSDAVLDVGLAAARLYVFGAEVPFAAALDYGGNAFTSAIAQAFAIAEDDAETRKRSMGLGGADDAPLAALSRSAARALRGAELASAREPRRLVLCGNGARLPELAERLARDLRCEAAIAEQWAGPSTYPGDVARANLPDWALAVGLALYDDEGRAA